MNYVIFFTFVDNFIHISDLAKKLTYRHPVRIKTEKNTLLIFIGFFSLSKKNPSKYYID